MFNYDFKAKKPNTYYCDCGGKDIEEIPAERIDYDVPSHYRRCKKCGFKDGPWVYAKDHWSGGFI